VFAVAAALGVAGELAHHSPFLLGGGEAHAIIGRPLTPMSYAGVARRTTRRAVWAGGAYGGGYGYGYGYARPYAAPPVGVVSTLPAGCGQVAGPTVYYNCGTANYTPYYNGPNVVYQPM
jgi:hypothetical protein